ncbi:MAG: hypothetical protein ACR2H6_13450 [Pyrinomonadaceae bacterium]
MRKAQFIAGLIPIWVEGLSPAPRRNYKILTMDLGFYFNCGRDARDPFRRNSSPAFIRFNCFLPTDAASWF